MINLNFSKVNFNNLESQSIIKVGHGKQKTIVGKNITKVTHTSKLGQKDVKQEANLDVCRTRKQEMAQIHKTQTVQSSTKLMYDV